ncbi:MAG: type IV secretion system protein [Bacteroidota bacterium]
MLLSSTEAAAQASTAQLNQAGWFTSAWSSFVTQLDAALNNVLASGSYVAWARNLMLGAFVIAFIGALGRYAMGAAGIVDLAEVLVTGAIVTALFTTYATWSGLLFQGAFELSLQIQQQALGTGDLMAPGTFPAKVLLSYTWQDSNLWQLSLAMAANISTFLILSILLSIASYFSAVWPVLVFAIAKIIGPFMFPFLFHQRTSGFFDGWLRFYAGTLVFMVVGRIGLIVVDLLFASLFGVPFSVNPQVGSVLVEAGDIGTWLMLWTVAGLSVLLLFATGGFVAVIIGGANLGIGKAIGSAARSIAIIAGKAV